MIPDTCEETSPGLGWRNNAAKPPDKQAVSIYLYRSLVNVSGKRFSCTEKDIKDAIAPPDAPAVPNNSEAAAGAAEPR